MMKKKLVEAASATFHIIIYEISYKNELIANQIKYITKGKEVNAVENVSTYAHTYIN